MSRRTALTARVEALRMGLSRDGSGRTSRRRRRDFWRSRPVAAMIRSSTASKPPSQPPWDRPLKPLRSTIRTLPSRPSPNSGRSEQGRAQMLLASDPLSTPAHGRTCHPTPAMPLTSWRRPRNWGPASVRLLERSRSSLTLPQRGAWWSRRWSAVTREGDVLARVSVGGSDRAESLLKCRRPMTRPPEELAEVVHALGAAELRHGRTSGSTRRSSI